MKKHNIIFFMCLMIHVVSTCTIITLDNLVQECYQRSCAKKSEQDCCITLSFKSFSQLRCGKKSINAFLQDQHIKNLFALRANNITKQELDDAELTEPSMVENQSNDEEYDFSSSDAQVLILAQLYAHFFAEYIGRTQSLMEELVEAKEHWKQELFYESLPWSRKNPMRWRIQESYQELLIKRICALEHVENQVCSLLGIILHGNYQISKICCMYDIRGCLANGVIPLYQYFNVPELCFKKGGTESWRLFQDANWLIDCTNRDLREFAEIVNKYRKPHHVARYKFAYAAAACTLATMLCVYKKYENKIPLYKQGFKEAFATFVQEYIVDAAIASKKILVNQGGDELPYLENSKPFPHVKDLATTRYLNGFNPTGPLERNINDTCIDPINERDKAFTAFINKLIEYTNKRFRTLLFLGAVFPTLGGGYLMYRFGNAGYNRYIKHDSWYKPMKGIVRSIDMLLNNILTKQEHSFCDDGKLYLLVVRLNSYIYCLSTEELFSFKEDISQLLSFDLTYSAKNGILARMYKTYEFLA